MNLGFGWVLYRQGGRMPTFQIEPKETSVRSQQNESGEYISQLVWLA